MSDIQSQLARYQPRGTLTDGQVLAMGARAWQDQQTLVVRLSLIHDPIIRQMAVTIADYVFGKRADG